MPTGIPIYQKIAPLTGEVTNEFEGTIRAQGLTLPTGDGVADPSEDYRVQWQRDPTGAMVAEIRTYSTATGVSAKLDRVLDTRPGAITQSQFDSSGPNGKSATITLETNGPGASSRAYASAWDEDTGAMVTLVDSNGVSSFLRSRAGGNSGVIGGIVDYGGGILSGEGFVVTRTAVGTYRIDLAFPTATLPKFAGVPIADAHVAVQYAMPTLGSVFIQTLIPGVAVLDSRFSFLIFN